MNNFWKELISLVIFSVPEWQAQHIPTAADLCYSFEVQLFQEKDFWFSTKTSRVLHFAPKHWADRFSSKQGDVRWFRMQGESMLEDHRPQPSKRCRLKFWQRWTTVRSESRGFRPETASLHLMDTPVWTGRIENIFPMSTYEVQTGGVFLLR